MTGSAASFEKFGTSIRDISDTLNAALDGGAGYADAFFEHTNTNNIILRDHIVSSAVSEEDRGVGVRAVLGEKSGYAFTESTGRDEMISAARFAAAIGKAGGTFSPIPLTLTGGLRTKNLYPVKTPWGNISVSEKSKWLQKLDDIIFQKDSRVVKVTASITDSSSSILFANSLGEWYEDERPLGSVSVTVTMQQGSHKETFSCSRSFRKGYEMITDPLINELTEKSVDGCIFLFGAGRPSPGEMPVVMGAGSSGILLHEAIGHAFEADFNRKGVSIFSDKMGSQICSRGINIVDDGTLSFNRGAINFDDEGVPSRKTYMVKDGILNSYLHDRISANFYNVSPTGNGRRESFRCIPIPRMRATYMENGDSDEESLIRSIKKGIYVDNFSNGQVQIGAGDFTFYVKSGYLIENGRLTSPIKDCNIIGNGPEALANIRGVADNLRIDDSTWTCGKSQHVPVCCGMPSVLISKLNVGGLA